nr:energy-coupling factor ABC transporter ATP-binding protein [Muribaculaceae bacterium]
MSHHYIQFSDVTYAYPDGTRALDHVSFLITHGEKVALLGLNGAGKSTLILHTNGILMPESGEVNVGDVPVCRKTLTLVRRSVGLVFQNSDDQLFMPTVEEDVAFGPLNMRLPVEEVDRRVDDALEAVGALDLRHRNPATLSGGQKKAVAIATVLSMGPSILVLDEPTSDLDCAARRRLINLLKGFDHTLLI